jgi:hypothetical protein
VNTIEHRATIVEGSPSGGLLAPGPARMALGSLQLNLPRPWQVSTGERACPSRHAYANLAVRKKSHPMLQIRRHSHAKLCTWTVLVSSRNVVASVTKSHRELTLTRLRSLG